MPEINKKETKFTKDFPSIGVINNLNNEKKEPSKDLFDYALDFAMFFENYFPQNNWTNVIRIINTRMQMKKNINIKQGRKSKIK